MGNDDICASIGALEDNSGAQEVRVVKGVCPHDCPDTCALETTVSKGVAIKVAGAKSHPFTDGVLCTKVARYLDRTYASDRVLYPMRRVGTKGRGKGNWRGDNSSTAAVFMLVFSPTSRPTLATRKSPGSAPSELRNTGSRPCGAKADVSTPLWITVTLRR